MYFILTRARSGAHFVCSCLRRFCLSRRIPGVRCPAAHLPRLQGRNHVFRCSTGPNPNGLDSVGLTPRPRKLRQRTRKGIRRTESFAKSEVAIGRQKLRIGILKDLKMSLQRSDHIIRGHRPEVEVQQEVKKEKGSPRRYPPDQKNGIPQPPTDPGAIPGSSGDGGDDARIGIRSSLRLQEILEDLDINFDPPAASAKIVANCCSSSDEIKTVVGCKCGVGKEGSQELELLEEFDHVLAKFLNEKGQKLTN